ncbi:hypothetical protein ACJX0J_034092, partial [Zea mays]
LKVQGLSITATGLITRNIVSYLFLIWLEALILEKVLMEPSLNQNQILSWI